MLLWEEYLDINPGGYSYSQFCVLNREWKKKLKPSLRQHHRAGDKMFVDYAGQTVPIVDGHTGEVTQAQIFVAVLGASNYTFAEATGSQDLFSWTSSHVRAFNFFGGVPRAVVPDNLVSLAISILAEESARSREKNRPFSGALAWMARKKWHMPLTKKGRAPNNRNPSQSP